MHELSTKFKIRAGPLYRLPRSPGRHVFRPHNKKDPAVKNLNEPGIRNGTLRGRGNLCHRCLRLKLPRFSCRSSSRIVGKILSIKIQALTTATTEFFKSIPGLVRPRDYDSLNSGYCTMHLDLIFILHDDTTFWQRFLKSFTNSIHSRVLMIQSYPQAADGGTLLRDSCSDRKKNDTNRNKSVCCLVVEAYSQLIDRNLRKYEGVLNYAHRISTSILCDCVQERGKTFSKASCYEDEKNDVHITARCHGRTIALRVPGMFTKSTSINFAESNYFSLRRLRSECKHVEFFPTLPGGVAGQEEEGQNLSRIEPAHPDPSHVAELTVQAQLISTPVRAGSSAEDDSNTRQEIRTLTHMLPHSVLSAESESSTNSEATFTHLTEGDEDEEAARALYKHLVELTGNVGFLPIDAVREVAERRTVAYERTFLEELHKKLRADRSDAELSGAAALVPFRVFFDAYVTIPRSRGARVRWAGTLGMETALARLLRPGDTFDGLRGLRELDAQEAEAHVLEVSKRFAAVLPSLLRAGLERLRASEVEVETEEEHFNAKFLTKGLVVGKFGNLDSFYKGPEALIGIPNPRIFQGIETEHCQRPNANQVFTSSNYNVQTWSKQEWEIVVCPTKDKQYPHTPVDKRAWPKNVTWYGECGREVLGVDELMKRETVLVEVKRAKLQKEEVICLRLYSGPMFLLYNAAMRDEPKSDVELLMKNKYETTIFVISSGITKLSKMTAIPARRLLYRGLAGDLQLPEQFWSLPSEYQVSLSIHATGPGLGPDILKQTLKGKIIPKQALSNASRSHLVLNMETNKCSGDSAAKDASGQLWDVGLIRAPYVDGNDVRLEVALPITARCMSETVVESFAKAIHDCCVSSLHGDLQDCHLKVTVDEVLDAGEYFKGGVELGMLSLTSSKEAALRYGKTVSGRRGTLFEIQVGRIDVGASIGFLSQYPREREYLVPPLSCLEVIGEPRLERLGKNSEIMVVPLRVNVNLKSQTVEELIERRMHLHEATAKNLKEELIRNVKEKKDQLECLFQRRGHGEVEILRGLPQNVQISQAADAGCSIHFSGSRWVTVGVPYLHSSEGKIFFEVKVEDVKGQLAVGFAGTGYRSDVKGDIGDDCVSWGIYSFDKKRHGDQEEQLIETFKGWFSAGSVIGLALDLSTGQILAKVSHWSAERDEDIANAGGSWESVFYPVFPSEKVGGGLYPVLAGGWGARISCNFGHTPMYLSPPSDEYQSVVNAAKVARSAKFPLSCISCQSYTVMRPVTEYALHWTANELLENLNEALVRDFEQVGGKHKMCKPADFNDDDAYKDILNQIIDAKACLERKQAAVVELLQAGATPGQLSIVSTAHAKDFSCSNTVQTEFTKYCSSWRLILSGWFRFLEAVYIPIEFAPSVIAVLWREVLKYNHSSPKSVIFGGSEKDHLAKNDYRVNVAALVPHLQLKKIGLYSRRFENAILALVLASVQSQVNSSLPDDGEDAGMSDAASSLTNVDFRGMDFSKERIIDLASAVFAGRLYGSISVVNGLVVTSMDGRSGSQNLKHGVSRDVKGTIRALNGVELGSQLDAVDWSFVTAEGARGGWQTLDLSNNALGPLGSTGLSIGLGAMTSLSLLDLSFNDLMHIGATQLSSALAELTALVRLELGHNKVGPDGASAIAQSLSMLTGLRRFGFSSNQIGPTGAASICDALVAHSKITSLDLSINSLDEQAGNAVAKLLQKLPDLEVIVLGGQDLGSAVYSVLTVLVPRIQSLKIAFGSVTAAPYYGRAASACNLRPPPMQPDPGQGCQLCTKIDLSGRQFLGVEGSGHLASVLEAGLDCGHLTALELAHNRLCFEGALVLTSVLIELSSLTHLDLSHNAFGPEGAQSFVGEISKLSELSKLELQGNEFGVAAWLSLSKSLNSMTKLGSLNGHKGYGAVAIGGLLSLNHAGMELAAAISSLLQRSSNTLTDMDASDSCLITEKDDVSSKDVITGFAFLTALTRLSIKDNSFGTVGADALGMALRSLTLLTSLDVSRVDLEKEGAIKLSHGLSHLRSLQHFHIAGNKIGPVGSATLCKALHVQATLLTFDLGDNAFGDDGACTLYQIHKSLSMLTCFIAPNNNFQPSAGEMIGKLLEYIPGLTELNLSSNKLEAGGVQIILNALANVAAESSAKLKVLNLSQNGVNSDASVAQSTFSGLKCLDSLETLILSSNHLTATGAGAVLEALGRHTALRVLDLGYIKLSQSGGPVMGSYLTNLTNLDSLYLEGNSLGKYGAAAVVKGLSKSKILRRLDLGNNFLKSDGGEALGKSLSNIASLCILDLDSNYLEKVGGIAVARGVECLTGLRSLDLRDNALGSLGCEQVAKQLAKFENLHLDLRWNELERRGHGKKPSSMYSRLLPDTPCRERPLKVEEDGKVMMRGWLRKLNAVQQGEIENDENWRDRLCFVTKTEMFYKSAKKKGQPEVVAKLNNISSVDAAASSLLPGHFIFYVHPRRQVESRTMVFSASSAAERSQWMAALAALIGSKRRQSFST